MSKNNIIIQKSEKVRKIMENEPPAIIRYGICIVTIIIILILIILSSIYSPHLDLVN